MLLACSGSDPGGSVLRRVQAPSVPLVPEGLCLQIFKMRDQHEHVGYAAVHFLAYVTCWPRPCCILLRENYCIGIRYVSICG